MAVVSTRLRPQRAGDVSLTVHLLYLCCTSRLGLLARSVTWGRFCAARHGTLDDASAKF